MTVEKPDYLIRNGLVVDGRSIARQDVLIDGGRVLEVGDDLSDAGARRTVDATGMYVLPGIIDAHNHPDNSDKIDTFTLSAAYGGITTVVPFVRGERHTGSDVTITETVRRFIEEARQRLLSGLRHPRDSWLDRTTWTQRSPNSLRWACSPSRCS